MAISAIALFFVTQNQGLNSITVLAFKAPKTVFPDTVVLSNINLGTSFSNEIPPLTGQNLESLGDQTIHTDAGSSDYRQVLRLSDTSAGFSGGMITHVKDQRGQVGDFMTFERNDPIFEWEGIFSPALESRVEDGRLVDLEDERMNILGRDYMFARAEVSGNTVTLRLVGPSFVQFTDDISDQVFTSKVEVGGRTVQGDVKIVGTTSSSRVRISSITYRLDADSKLGGDVLVPPRRGVRQIIREPSAMLNPYFEIIYGGLKGGVGSAAVPATPRLSGNAVLFKPSGDDEYKLGFTNNRGQSYYFPFAVNVGGSLRLGDSDRTLHVREGANNADFDITQGDLFVVTSGTDIKASSNVLEFDEADVSGGTAYFVDLSGASRSEPFDTATGKGILNVGGNQYDFFVDLASPNNVVIDLDNDGNFESDKVDIVILGGGRIQIGNTAGATLNLDFHTPERLFDEATSDEEVDINIVSDGNDINLEVSTSSTLDLEKDNDDIMKGMTPFGVLFQLDDESEPSQLVIDFPTGGRQPAAFVRGGQAQGWIIVTLELDRLMAEAQERAR